MNTCKTCKHWVKPHWFDPKKERVERAQCMSKKLNDNFGEPQPDGLSYEYLEGGIIFTGPDFGCVHHEVANA